MSDELATWVAQLDDMPFEVIEGWLVMRGWVVVSRDWHRRRCALDVLKTAHRARSEALPFDGDARDE